MLTSVKIFSVISDDTFPINIFFLSNTNSIELLFIYSCIALLIFFNTELISLFCIDLKSFSIKSTFSVTGEDVKLSERLLVPSSKLRGFEYGKVGPKDGTDFIGGNYVTSFNVQSTLPFLFENAQNLDMILFFDSANVWGVDYDSSIDDNNKLRSSIGVGIDWFTPIGPMTFSLSEVLSKSNTDVTETFRFNIGTSF